MNSWGRASLWSSASHRSNFGWHIGLYSESMSIQISIWIRTRLQIDRGDLKNACNWFRSRRSDWYSAIRGSYSVVTEHLNPFVICALLCVVLPWFFFHHTLFNKVNFWPVVYIDKWHSRAMLKFIYSCAVCMTSMFAIRAICTLAFCVGFAALKVVLSCCMIIWNGQHSHTALSRKHLLRQKSTKQIKPTNTSFMYQHAIWLPLLLFLFADRHCTFSRYIDMDVSSTCKYGQLWCSKQVCPGVESFVSSTKVASTNQDVASSMHYKHACIWFRTCNRESTEHKVSSHIMLLQRTLTPTWTQALTRLITRRGIRAQYKPPLVTQSEVTFTRYHSTWTFNMTLSVDRIAITLQDRVAEVSGLSHGIISKCHVCTRVSRALLHLHRRTQIDTDLRVDTKRI